MIKNIYHRRAVAIYDSTFSMIFFSYILICVCRVIFECRQTLKYYMQHPTDISFLRTVTCYRYFYGLKELVICLLLLRKLSRKNRLACVRFSVCNTKNECENSFSAVLWTIHADLQQTKKRFMRPSFHSLE